MARLNYKPISERELLTQLIGRAKQGPLARTMLAVAGTAEAKAREYAERDLNKVGEEGESYHDSFQSDLVRRPKVGVVVRNTAPHATFIEEGTDAHFIVPKRAQVLMFTPEGEERPVFTLVVFHPGTRPYKILEQAVEFAIRFPRKPRF